MFFHSFSHQKVMSLTPQEGVICLWILHGNPTMGGYDKASQMCLYPIINPNWGWCLIEFSTLSITTAVPKDLNPSEVEKNDFDPSSI